MGFRSRAPVKKSMRRLGRNQSSEPVVNGEDCDSLTEKLEALKRLIPAMAAKNGDIKIEQLFLETAEYIVFLEAEISIMQKLLDLCGPSEKQNDV